MMRKKLAKQSKPNFLNFLSKPDERTIIIGMTGSGKTFLAEKLLAWRKFVVVYDLKGLIDWSGYVQVTTLEALYNCEHPKIIFKPPLHFVKDKEAVEDFFQWVYRRGNCTLYVDEIMSACFKGQISYWLLVILTRGRELGVSFVGATQRPKQIPQNVMTESENRFIFLLSNFPDAKRVEENYGIEAEAIQNLPKRYFYFSSIERTYNRPFILSE